MVYSTGRVSFIAERQPFHPLTSATPFGERVIDATDVDCYAGRDHKVGPRPGIALREPELNPQQLRQCRLPGPAVMPLCIDFGPPFAEIREFNKSCSGEKRFLFDR